MRFKFIYILLISTSRFYHFGKTACLWQWIRALWLFIFFICYANISFADGTYYDSTPLTVYTRLKERKYHSEQDPLYKTAMVWMPTALTVGSEENKLGFDVGGQYLWGNLIKKTRFGRDDLTPLDIWYIFADAKYSFFPEGEHNPMLACGYTVGYSIGKVKPTLIEALQKPDVDGEVLTNTYIVFTKRWDEKRTFGTHLGYNHGDMNRLIAALNEDIYIDEGGAIFLGVTKQFKKGRQLKFEWIIPVGEDETPIVMNTFLSGLFGFRLSFLKYDTGYAIAAGGGFRLPFWPRISAGWGTPETK
ncbi:MAG: hypothetical protein AB1765_01555 [Candidatus Hydrogenedentota bacterium]